MSTNVTYFDLSFLSQIKPIEIPATGSFMGTPASINAKVEPQAEAIDVEPAEDKTSETTRSVYGKSSCEGKTGKRALSAKAPWPISLLPGGPRRLTSPVENGGKL